MKYASLELKLPGGCWRQCSSPGSADDCVAYWMARPDIRKQLDSIDFEDSCRILYGYGAWEVEELMDFEANKQRLLWLACGDIRDNPGNQNADGTGWAYLEGHGYERELEAVLSRRAA